MFVQGQEFLEDEVRVIFEDVVAFASESVGLNYLFLVKYTTTNIEAREYVHGLTRYYPDSRDAVKDIILPHLVKHEARMKAAQANDDALEYDRANRVVVQLREIMGAIHIGGYN